MVTIEWKLLRLDEGEPERRPIECLLEVSGSILVDGEPAGWVWGFLICARDLSSDSAFWDLWDIDGRTCNVFGRIQDEKWLRVREPLPRLLVDGPGILCLEEFVLFSDFRGRGLGLEVLREVVRSGTNERVGALLLRSDPIQYRWEGETAEQDQAVASLPVADEKRDQERLQYHLRTWGMQLLPRTTYMVCAPEVISAERAKSWPPCTIQDLSNTCVLCGGLIDYRSDPWERTSEGLVHGSCLGL